METQWAQKQKTQEMKNIDFRIVFCTHKTYEIWCGVPIPRICPDAIANIGAVIRHGIQNLPILFQPVFINTLDPIAGKTKFKKKKH